MGFDGTGYIQLPSVFFATTMTLEAWFRMTGYAGNPRILSNDHTDSSPGRGFELVVNSGGSSGLVAFGLGPTYASAGWNQSVSLDEWYHYVGVFDSTYVYAYINAVQLVKNTSPSGTLVQGGYNANIGRDPAYDGDYVIGNLAHIAIYPYPLTQGQITNHYEAASSSLPNAYKNVVLSDKPMAYWPLDDATGPWVHDEVLRAVI